MRPSNRHQALTIVGIVTLFSLGSCTSTSKPSRQAEVATKGADIMPFDLTKTAHKFTKATNGGLQTVTANDPNDTTQVKLIREHLNKERARFSQGDFSDPTSIHGTNMPGVAALATGASSVTVTYRDLPIGAELTFTTPTAPLVDAIHLWFDAQSSDHGTAGHKM